MKKLLLGSTMLIGAGSLASGADASDGIKLDVGGFFRVCGDLVDGPAELGKLCDLVAALRDTLGLSFKTLGVRASQKGLELTLHVAPEVPDALHGGARPFGERGRLPGQNGQPVDAEHLGRPFGRTGNRIVRPAPDMGHSLGLGQFAFLAPGLDLRPSAPGHVAQRRQNRGPPLPGAF